MMHTDQVFRSFEHGPAIIRALRSLTLRDADLIAQALGATGNGWSVQTYDECEGYLSILVEPKDGTVGQPSYLISGPVNRIELALVSDDNLRTLGCFQNLAIAAEELIQLLQK